jgi:pimeloyl-ACP methyl ester carboxylesterase
MARTPAVVEIDGLPIWYETDGAGDALVLLHGGLSSNASWGAQFDGLAPHLQVIAPERRAHGHTPDVEGPLTYEGMAAETAAVLRRLDVGPAHLLGWSDGGMVGLLLAMDEPGLVRTLTVTGTGFSLAGYVPGPIDDLLLLPADHEELAVFSEPYAAESPDGAGHFSVVWEKIRQLWRAPFDWSGRLGLIEVPTLVIVGDDDVISVTHAEQLARGVQRGQLAVIPGASHAVPVEKPALFNQLVLEFTANAAVDTLMPVWRDPGRRSSVR